MTRARLLLTAGAAVTCVAMAAPAAHAARTCPAIAAPVSGELDGITEFNPDQPQGGDLSGRRIRFPGHFYKTEGAIRIRVRGNHFAVGAGSIFKFTCYGTSKVDPKLKPALDLLRGSVTVRSSSRVPGGVITEEALVDPREVKRMQFTVKRRLSMFGEPELGELLEWFSNSATQPTGTTSVTTAGPVVGVTPYVGSRRGSSRYVRGATLTTKGRYGRGTAKYRY